MSPRNKQQEPYWREVYTIRPGGVEEFNLGGFTSDEACLDFAKSRAELEVTAHLGKRAGTYHGDQEPAMQVVARGLRARPGFKAWFPAVIATLRLLRHKPPGDADMPKVHDYRTAAGRRIRNSDKLPDLWSRPKVQALGKRLGWPGY